MSALQATCGKLPISYHVTVCGETFVSSLPSHSKRSLAMCHNIDSKFAIGLFSRDLSFAN